MSQYIKNQIAYNTGKWLDNVARHHCGLVRDSGIFGLRPAESDEELRKRCFGFLDAASEPKNFNCKSVIKPAKREHNHYFKPCPYDEVDVYRVLTLFNVTDPCIQHAVKKLLVAGGRGAGKDIGQDVAEAMDALTRWHGMRKEEKNNG